MRFLMVGPFPPPYTGNSRPFKEVEKMFRKKGGDIKIINVSEIYHSNSIKKVFWWLRNIFQILNFSGHKVYYSLAESTGGIWRDFLMIHILSKNSDDIYIHLLGGYNFKRKSNSAYRRLMKSYIRKCKGVIVEGETQAEIFYDLGHTNILINKNFVDKVNLNLVTKMRVWRDKTELRVLYLSNMLHGKGWLEVYKASQLLVGENIQFDFVGNAEPWFIEKLNQSPNCEYLGFINGTQKERLFKQAHVFVMPTYYEYEGQPFSIIEAMSFGCLIGTTYHSGIVDVFKDGFNGKRLLKHDINGLANWIKEIAEDSYNYEHIIGNNIEQVREYHQFDDWIEKLENFVFV